MSDASRQYSYLYGPVPSRRLGRSLGVDLIPFKVCSYDCIYCQLGPTTLHTSVRAPYTPAEQIIAELERWLTGDGDADYVTLCGSGEPALNSQLGLVVEFLRQRCDIPLALLTNGSLFCDPQLRAEIRDLDLLMPSLDAATEDVWQQVNVPASGLDMQQVISGISCARRECEGKMWLEVMLVAGVNDSDDELQAIREAVEQIGPDRVQINTVVRPPAQSHARPLTPDRLRHALEVLGPKAEIIAPLPDDHAARIPHQQTAEAVFELLRRRPCTTADLAVGLSIHPNEAIKHVQSLLADKRIRALEGQGATYYAARWTTSASRTSRD